MRFEVIKTNCYKWLSLVSCWWNSTIQFSNFFISSNYAVGPSYINYCLAHCGLPDSNFGQCNWICARFMLWSYKKLGGSSCASHNKLVSAFRPNLNVKCLSPQRVVRVIILTKKIGCLSILNKRLFSFESTLERLRWKFYSNSCSEFKIIVNGKIPNLFEESFCFRSEFMLWFSDSVWNFHFPLLSSRRKCYSKFSSSLIDSTSRYNVDESEIENSSRNLEIF